MTEAADLRAAFVEGMSRAATFVAVATTDGEGGRDGVTVSSMTKLGATPSGAVGPPSPSPPPPQAANSSDTASAEADKANLFERCFMAIFLTNIKTKETSEWVGVGPHPGAVHQGNKPCSHLTHRFMKAVS